MGRLAILILAALAACETTHTSESNPTVEFHAMKGCWPDASEDPIISKCGYFHEVRERIAKKWEYPQDASKTGQEGEVGAELTIKNDGTLQNARITRTSGKELLDKSLLTAINSAAPFPRFPSDIRKETIKVTGDFRYLLK